MDRACVPEGPRGRQTLGDLFDGRSQLLVDHFVFDPEWEEGCNSRCFRAHSFDGVVVHPGARDARLVAVSRAPWETLEAFRRRTGWRFAWVSSFPGAFNRDDHVSSPTGERTAPLGYHYAMTDRGGSEAPGPARLSAGTGRAAPTTPPPATRAGSTPATAPINCWTWCPRDATRRACPPPWPGCGATIATGCRSGHDRGPGRADRRDGPARGG